ncbi:MAG: lasso peptide biosynthesis B2 protein [Chloroflexota bacterium]
MLTRSLRRFLALSGPERALLIRAYVDLLQIDVALRIFGFQRVVRRVPPASADRVVRIEDRSRAGQYARWLEVAARHHVARARCLQRSLALHRWLRQEGLPSELRIGVRKEAGVLQAHAWVELGDQVVNDRPDAIAEFAPLASPSLPSLVWSRDLAGGGPRPPAVINQEGDR